MTFEEKVLRLMDSLRPEEAQYEELGPYILDAEDIVLNRLYPFGYAEGTQVPQRYEHIQLRIALELYNKRGAEGETAHTENGVQRVYESGEVSASLLNQIIPMCASVIRS